MRAEARKQTVLEIELDEEDLILMMLRSVRLSARRGDEVLFRNEHI